MSTSRKVKAVKDKPKGCLLVETKGVSRRNMEDPMEVTTSTKLSINYWDKTKPIPSFIASCTFSESEERYKLVR